MRRLSTLALVLLAAVLAALATAVTVRERRLPTFAGEPRRGAAGVFHVHSDQSHDSSLPLQEIVAAATANGLDFVVLTDHNQEYAAPLSRDGVTVLSSAELSTPFGHLIQLGASPVLPEHERRGLDVMTRVRRLGGAPVLAHPDDEKRPWEGPMEGVGGIEIVNLSASTRRVGGPAFVGLLPALLALPLNPELAIAQLYDRDVRALERWDGELGPEVAGLCGVDAHGWLEPTLNLRAWTLVLTQAMPEVEAERAAFVTDSLRGGRFTCVAGLLGRAGVLTFAANDGERELAGPGGTVSAAQVKALTAHVPPLAGSRLSLVLFRNGEAIFKLDQHELSYPSPAPGTYRVEAWAVLPGLLFGEQVVPVAYSNRIRLTGEAKAASAEAGP